MIRVAYAQRSLVEVLLPDGEKLWDPVLRHIGAELEDGGLLAVMVEALARRSAAQLAAGPPGHAGHGRAPDARAQAPLRLELR